VSRGALLNVNKPPGITSRDAVNRVQRLVRPAKVGHSGTLDPLASGVLVIAVGAATRLVEFVQQMPKLYRATFLLGRASTTEDVEGIVTLVDNPPVPSLDELTGAAGRLVGDISQRPPAYSALKIAGRRAYKLARRGETPELAPRSVTIHRFDLLRYEYPELDVEIACSSGTYVRSLGRDLAESLGTAAVMSALVRTAVGSFQLDDACDLEQLTDQTLSSKLLPIGRAVELLPRVELTDDEARAIRHGKTIACAQPPGGEQCAAFDVSGELIAVLVVAADHLVPLRVMPFD
jgi:tRNA pseudouridine55 synthase